VIVNKSGGCYHFEDCPLPSKYAIPSREIACRDIDPYKVGNLVLKALENYDQAIKEFQYYRDYVASEPNMYRKDIQYLLDNYDFFQ